MANNAQGMLHDITLLEQAIAIAAKTVASGLLSAAECEAFREDMICLEGNIATLNGRLDLVR